MTGRIMGEQAAMIPKRTSREARREFRAKTRCMTGSLGLPKLAVTWTR